MNGSKGERGVQTLGLREEFEIWTKTLEITGSLPNRTSAVTTGPKLSPDEN
jgi:hypothetical protein